MKNINNTYHELLEEILTNGYDYTDKSRDVICKQIAYKNLEIDLKQGLPVLTTKKIAKNTAIHETVWFLTGDSNIKYLVDNNVKIWNKDSYNYYKKNIKRNIKPDEQNKFLTNNNEEYTFEEFIDRIKKGYLPRTLKTDNTWYQLGDVGRMYGQQLRNWNGHEDQLLELIKNARKNIYNRGNLISYWNPTDIPYQALRTCHWSWEIVPDKDNTFNLIWNQRSTDTFLGLGFNIFGYSLFAHIIGLFINKKPNMLIGRLSNVHLYENQIDAAKAQLKNDPNKYPLPTIEFSTEYLKKLKDNPPPSSRTELNNLLPSFNDIKIVNYNSYPPIKVEMLAPKE